MEAVPNRLPATDLPDIYVPQALLPLEDREILPPQVTYSCGYKNDRLRDLFWFEIFWGPNPELKRALNVLPSLFYSTIARERNAYILRYNSNGTEDVLYEWSHKRSLWRRIGR